jgi:hypothetical protein
MPLVRLEVRQGRSATQKQALLDAAHAALVEALGIPDHDRMQRIRWTTGASAGPDGQRGGPGVRGSGLTSLTTP